MSKLEQLIAEHCPDGVEHKTLRELGEFYGGLTGKSKYDFRDGNAKFITYMNVLSNLAVNIDVVDRVKIAVGERQRAVKLGDILFTGSSETPEECGMSSVVLTEIDELMYLNSFCFGFRMFNASILLPEFTKYLFRSDELRKQIVKTASGVTRFNVSKEKMKRVVIPIPPLPVQVEIISILDKFTELTKELTAELTKELAARKKQYEYYLNAILIQPDVKRYTVGDLFEFKNGLNKGKEFFGKGTPIVNFTDVFKHITLTAPILKGRVEVTSKEQELYSAHKNDVFFTRTSETQEEIGMTSVLLDDIEGCVFSGFVLRARPTTDLLLPKYCSYIFASDNVRKEIVRHSTYTTRALTSGTRLSQLKIPVPSLAEQTHIVAILDKFDALTTDITAGLPAEIAARQKQYEYYRDKLLTFPSLRLLRQVSQ